MTKIIAIIIHGSAVLSISHLQFIIGYFFKPQCQPNPENQAGIALNKIIRNNMTIILSVF